MTACVKRFVPSRHALLAVVVTLAAVPTGVAPAADFGAIVPVGNWVTAANWNRASAPLAGDNVFIGSTTPGGSATTSAITLTQNHAASNVYLGYGNATAGTLQLGNFNLTADSLTLGANGTGTGVVGRGTGTLTVAGAIAVNTAGSFAFAAGDVTSTLNLTTNSTATTATAGNITRQINLSGGSTLTLSDKLTLGTYVEVTGSTLNAQTKDITATSGIYLYDATALITNRGKLTTNYLQVTGQNFNLLATDAVANFSLNTGTTALPATATVGGLFLSSATATTAAVGNVTGDVYLNTSSTLTLNDKLTLTGYLQISNSTVNAQNKDVSAAVAIYLNDAAALLSSRGKLTTNFLYVRDQNFNVLATDAVTNFDLAGGTTTLPAGYTFASLALGTGTGTTALPATTTVGDFSLTAASATTAAAGNITGNVTVSAVGTLTLGANLTLSGNLQVSNSTLNAQNKDITAPGGIYLYNAAALITSRGKLTTNYLQVAGQNFNLLATDAVANFNLTGGNTTLPGSYTLGSLSLNTGSTALPATATVGDLSLAAATATTAAVGNITGNVGMSAVSTLTINNTLTLAGNLQITNSTLNAQNNDITATFGIYLSDAAALITSRGKITTNDLRVTGQAFNLSATDAVERFDLTSGSTAFASGATVKALILSGSTATLAATANVTGDVVAFSGSTLTLGSNLSLTNNLHVFASTVNAQNHEISAAGGISLHDATAVISNRGKLTTPSLSVRGQPFALASIDAIGIFSLTSGSTSLAAGVTVQQFNLDASTATTATTANITGGVQLDAASTLTLNDKLAVTNYVDVRSSTFNAQGKDVTADRVYFGWFGGPTVVQNLGTVTTNIYLQGNTTNVDLPSGKDVLGSVTLSQGSVLRVKAGGTGLTITGTNVGAIAVNDTSKLRLELDGTKQGWLLRWANPAGGGDHFGDINALIAAGGIDFVVTNGGLFTINSLPDGYTYLFQPVPEPATVLLAGVGGLGLLAGVRRRLKVPA